MKVKYNDIILDDTNTKNKFDTFKTSGRTCINGSCSNCCYNYDKNNDPYCLILNISRKFPSYSHIEIAQIIIGEYTIQKENIFVQEEMEI